MSGFAAREASHMPILWFPGGRVLGQGFRLALARDPDDDNVGRVRDAPGQGT